MYTEFVHCFRDIFWKRFISASPEYEAILTEEKEFNSQYQQWKDQYDTWKEQNKGI